jgi:hypothetical protein
MDSSALAQKRSHPSLTHGDRRRLRLQKEYGLRAIDGRTRSGKQAIAWRDYAMERKGGKECPPGIKLKIVAGTFALWRALELCAFITDDHKKRGSLLNKRYRVLPSVNNKYDTAYEQWRRINDELQLDQELDLAQRLMLEHRQKSHE